MHVEEIPHVLLTVTPRYFTEVKCGINVSSQTNWGAGPEDLVHCIVQDLAGFTVRPTAVQKSQVALIRACKSDAEEAINATSSAYMSRGT